MARVSRIFLIPFVLATAFSIPGPASADLSVLVEVARSQADMQKEYQKETENYKRIKRALESGALVNGRSKDEIRKEYGEPVVAFNDFVKKMEEWIYKSADSSFFSGPRICLFFDENGRLAEIESR